MGAGKTSWSIQHIDKCSFENILYITPFLTECDRIIANTKRDFKEPIHRGSGKLFSLNEMLSCHEDIVSTHQLFRHVDKNSRKYIEDGKYTLILDEVLNVIEPYPIKKNDIQILKDSGCISIDENGFIVWDENKMNYETRFDEIKTLAENKSLLFINNILLLWKYPPDIFKLFKKVYVLTYMFEASILKYYFDLHFIQYEKMSVKCIDEQYELCDYFMPDTRMYSDMINIYDGTLNLNISQKDTALSATWFNAQHNKGCIQQLQRNIYNYFANILKAKSDTILWTTFKKSKSKLQGRGYTKRFLSCNCRSTNDYADRYNLAYCINIYLHPAVSHYFRQHGIIINEDLYATSEMLQWIWRSSVRNGEKINIYVASNRMRDLLENWLKYPNFLKDNLAS